MKPQQIFCVALKLLRIKRQSLEERSAQLPCSLACARKYCLVVLVIFLSLTFGSFSKAETVRIVALGASNTAGKGVGSSQAWPAQLAAMLRAKGYDVNLTVDALNGDTSAGIAKRAHSIRAGTQVVIFDTGGANDRRAGTSSIDRRANIGRIEKLIRARGATPIKVSYLQIPPSLRQPDGIHLTAAGHARIAAELVPRVIASMAKRR